MKSQTDMTKNGAEQNAALYRAALYARLSKEDLDSARGNKAESNSIQNQKQLMLDYLRDKADIQVVSIREDDGYTGTDYDRPQFQRMMEDIKAGVVNCVIVKDLSRFGREYINAGKYIDRLFPYYGVRLIAINDNIDTLTRQDAGGFDIIIKNLMNDNYCRDISVKIRSQLQVKRKNGEFIGAYTPYGYQKSEDNKNQLVIDPYAAGVVQDIFRWKLEGFNQRAIAKRLAAQGILSPMEYKRSKGVDFKTAFKRNGKAAWSEMAVRRILTNPVYIGTLVQGVRTRPSYKIKTVVVKEKEEWTVVEGAHEAIVEPKVFRLVERLMELDTRTSPREEKVFPLAGLLVCGDCKGAMVRKTTTSGKKKFGYFVCGAHKKDGSCSSHQIAEAQIETAVLQLLQEHIRVVTELDNCLKAVQDMPFRQINAKKLEERLTALEAEIDRYQHLKTAAYEDMKDGVLTKEDYCDIRDQYASRIADAAQAREQVRKEMDACFDKAAPRQWVQDIMEHRNLRTLSRAVAAECIDHIEIFEGKRIEVAFTHMQDYAQLLEHVQAYGQWQKGVG